jgi:hypothetical protein
MATGPGVCVGKGDTFLRTEDLTFLTIVDVGLPDETFVWQYMLRRITGLLLPAG